jgi:MFS family permease
MKSKRNFYKSAIITLSFLGFLTYGYIADKKGRKIAMKISWRFYTIGVLIFCSTQTELLMMFGYFIASINCFPSLILQFILMFETTNSQMRLKSFLSILASGFFGSLLSALIAGLIIDNFGHIRLTIFLTVGLPALILCFFLDYI